MIICRNKKKTTEKYTEGHTYIQTYTQQYNITYLIYNILICAKNLNLKNVLIQLFKIKTYTITKLIK